MFPEEIASTDNYSLEVGPFGSNLKVSDYTTSGMPMIFVWHITSRNFNLDSKYVSQKRFEELLPHSVKPLDLLITKMGDRQETVRFILKEEKKGSLHLIV